MSANTTPVAAAIAQDDEAWRQVAASSIEDATGAPASPSSQRMESTLSAAVRERGSGTIIVEILGDPGAIAAAVDAAGGTLGRGGGGLYQAMLPANRVQTIADSTGVEEVRMPQFAPRPEAAPSIERGVWTGGHADRILAWHNAGLIGTGVKVGVIGLFDPAILAAERASGDIVNDPAATMCVSAGVPCPFGTPGQSWGNSLAEIVSDGAPGASLVLAELGTRSDYYIVIDWLVAQGVTIVVNPIVWTYDGPGNGTGPSAAIIDYAVAKGLAWFNTAGEMATAPGYSAFHGGYWRGQWSDPDNDRILNFNGSDESLSAYCGYLLGLRWNDWGAGKTDYDLYIGDYNVATRSSGTKKLLSANVQNDTGQPLEATGGVSLCNTNPARGAVYDTNKDGFVSLWVIRKSTSSKAGSTGDLLEIGALYGWLEYASDDASISLAFADSKNPGMATVGGEDQFTGWARSSRGPTNDGRTKPDLLAPMCTTTTQAGQVAGGCDSGYYGADGAAAVAASFAAIAQAEFDIPSPGALMLYMRDNSWDQRRVTLPGYLPPESYSPGGFIPLDSPQRVVDTRTGLGLYGGARQLVAQETISFGVNQYLNVSGATAVLNVAIVGAPARGWIGLYPAGYSYPGASSVLNANAGDTRANMVIVPQGYGGYQLHTSVGGHVIVDLVGYLRPIWYTGWPQDELGAGRLNPIEPFRHVDSRTCDGLTSCNGQPLAAGSYTDVVLSDIADPDDASNTVPADATAVAFSLTVDTPAARGWASVVPAGQNTTPTSNINFSPGQSATTMVFAPVSAETGGVARVFVSAAAHVQIDVLGWFTPATGIADTYGLFVPLTPVRALDTRNGPLPAAESHVVVDVAAVGVPDSAIAVMVNNVSTGSTAAGEVQVSGGVPGPGHPVRQLTYGVTGQTIAGSTLSTLEDGNIVLTPTAPTNLITDVSGYWTSYEGEAAAPGSVRLVSHGPNGEPPNASVTPEDIADDGSAVIFRSLATNLTVTSTGTDVFLWRRSSDTVIELPYSGAAFQVADEGDLVAFRTDASLVAGDTDGQPDMYLWRLSTNELTLVPFTYVSSQDRLDLAQNGSTLALTRGGQSIPYDIEGGIVGALVDGALLSIDGSSIVRKVSGLFTCDIVRTDLATRTTTQIHIAESCGGVVQVSSDGRRALVERGFNMHASYWIVDIATQVRQLLYTNNQVLVLPQPVAADPGLTTAAMIESGSSRLFTTSTASGSAQYISLTTTGESLGASVNSIELTADNHLILAIGATDRLEQPTEFGGIYIVDLAAL